jgi:hypothetical protein
MLAKAEIFVGGSVDLFARTHGSPDHAIFLAFSWKGMRYTQEAV